MEWVQQHDDLLSFIYTRSPDSWMAIGLEKSLRHGSLPSQILNASKASLSLRAAILTSTSPHEIGGCNADIVASTRDTVLHALCMAQRAHHVAVFAPCFDSEEESLSSGVPVYDQSMVWIYTALGLVAESQPLAQDKPRISLFTMGLLGPCSGCNGPAAASQALALGVSRTLFMEDQTAYGVTIDVGRDTDGWSTLDNIAGLASTKEHYLVALYKGCLYSERLKHAAPASTNPVQGPSVNLPDVVRGKTVIITGGLKGLGFALAQQMTERTGLSCLALTGRTFQGEEAFSAVRRLQGAGRT